MTPRKEVKDRRGVPAIISYGPRGKVLISRSLRAYGVHQIFSMGDIFPFGFNNDEYDRTIEEDAYLRRKYSHKKIR